MTSFTECWARDGIQAEPYLSLEQKLAVLDAVSAMGVSRVEVASMSRATAWPQFADADDVIEQFRDRPGVDYSVYVPNVRGLERLLANPGAGKIATVLVAVASSDSYNRKNVGRSLEEAMVETCAVVESARSSGRAVIGCVGTAWACPIEGPVAEATVLGLAERLLSAGATEVTLGDTTGEADLRSTRSLIAAVKRGFDAPVSGHFHDARGTALANALAALEAGADRIEGALGGVGGHPPDADQAAPSPNLCTEDFLSTAHAAGFEVEGDLEAVLAAGRLAAAAVGRSLSRIQQNGRPMAAREGVA